MSSIILLAGILYLQIVSIEQKSDTLKRPFHVRAVNRCQLMVDSWRVYGTGDRAGRDQAGPAASTTSRATEQASAAHQAVVQLTIELKQLELLAAEIEESAIQSSAAAATALTAAEDAQTSLEAAQRDAQVNT